MIFTTITKKCIILKEQYSGEEMKKTQAIILLIAVFAARGTSFLFSKELLQTMGPLSILGWRFISAFIILALIFHKKLFACSKKSLFGGVVLGILYTVCMVLEMFGLKTVDTGTSALIENMAIVLVPIFVGILTKSFPKKKTLFCAALAIIGVAFLSFSQGASGSGGIGIVLTILAAVCYAFCIMATEKVSRDADPLTVGMIQLGVMGVLSFLVSLPVEGFSPPGGTREWLLLLFLIFLCSCFGFAFQPLGQKYLPAETAAILTVVNPFTASILGFVVAKEGINATKIAGYAFILLALIIYNLNIKGKKSKNE